jgi:hypothetical protein
MMQDVIVGMWLVHRQSGRVGRVIHVSPKKRLIQLQFGADGPFEKHSPSRLRFAEKHEIPEGIG